MRLVKLPKASDKVKEVLGDIEIEKVLSSFNNKTELGLRNAIIFNLAYDAGIREGGICNMTISDVDFKAKTIKIRLKGGNITIFPLGNTVLRQIREYIIKYRESCAGDEPLLTDNKGGSTENAIKKVFTKLKVSTGLSQINCHLGRHYVECFIMLSEC